MYSLQICQFIIVCIDARAKEQPRIPSIYYLGHVAEFNEVGLVFLVPGRNEAVDLAELVAFREIVFEVS